MARTDLTCAQWRKSSHSAYGDDCVELAGLAGAVAVRDSKNPAGPALVFTPTEIGRFIRKMKTG